MNCVLDSTEDCCTCKSHRPYQYCMFTKLYKREKSCEEIYNIPVVTLFPVTPCHSIVQPPHWYPRLSAWLPATSIFEALLGRGRSAWLGFSPIEPVLELGWGLGELLSSDVTRSVVSHVPPLVFFAERLLRLVGYLQMPLQRSSQWGVVFGWLEYCR